MSKYFCKKKFLYQVFGSYMKDSQPFSQGGLALFIGEWYGNQDLGARYIDATVMQSTLIETTHPGQAP